MTRLVVAPNRPRYRQAPVVLRRARPMMGTLVGITVRGDDPEMLEDLVRRMFGEIGRLEGILSEWQPGSAVSAVNRAAGKSPVQIPSELVEVMQLADQVARATSGAFDTTWSALAEIWKLETPGFKPPESKTIAVAQGLVDYRDILLDAKAETLFLRQAGMRLGLGGVAKAFVAEQAADFAVASGAHDVLVDAGGDLVARGRNGRRRWTVGIRDPRLEGSLLATANLCDEAIATSGYYEHFADVDGHRYHHILDPRTGTPASKSRSVTVIAQNGALADALATGLFVLGPEGLNIVPSFDHVAALVVDTDGVAHVSAGGAARFGVKKLRTN